ncbi:DksA DnaK suppressor protein [Acidimicrobiia bacterium]
MTDAESPNEALNDLHDRLSDQIEELEARTAAPDTDASFSDTAQVTAEIDEQRSLTAELRELLDDVERALARLDDGTYGTCEICSGEIGDERLAEVPATRFCIEHAA